MRNNSQREEIKRQAVKKSNTKGKKKRNHFIQTSNINTAGVDPIVALRFLLFVSLQAGVSATTETALELFNSTCRVDILQLARVERMAFATNVDLKFRLRTTRLERVATTAGYRRLHISGVDAFLHDLTLKRIGRTERARL